MTNQPKIKLQGTFKPLAENQKFTDLNKEENITVTIRLRRKKELPNALPAGQLITRENYETEYGTSQKDIEEVLAFTQSHSLTTVEVNPARRSIIVQGTISNFESAFGIEMKGLQSHRVLPDEISIPENLKEIIKGVFGLDTRPIARPMFQVAKTVIAGAVSLAASPQSFTPVQLAELYGFPTGVTGKGECIGVIELGGGFRTADITNYFKGLGISAPNVTVSLVDGGKNSPSTSDGADGEVMLDIEVAGAVANEANIVVYFCPNTDQGFLDAITSAIHDTKNNPSVISISWGSAEVNWTQQALDNYNEAFKAAAALGVTICAAAGDSGSRDGETDGNVHVDFPASSPYVLACGGTSLKVSNGIISSETVWHDSTDSASGGGVSGYFALPDYQASANVPLDIDTNFQGRGVPDVAGNADPNTGYKVLVDGDALVIGGTSAVAPLMAGLIALLNEQNGKPAGYIHPLIYSTPNLCRDITTGNNKTTSNNTGYIAGPGWDACTGLGVLSKLS